MGDDLGERLVRVGLLTRSALSEALDTVPTHNAALVRALCDRGLAEDAVSGFFVAEGFGPLLEARDLALADPATSERLPTQMALEFLVLPLRPTTAGVVLAMATPSDKHILSEARRALGREVVPTVARPSDIERAIRAQRPDAADFESDGRHDDAGRDSESLDSQPLVLELTRRRSSPDAGGYHAAPSSEARSLKLVIAPAGADDADEEPALLLVRHKAVARVQTPATGVGRPSKPSLSLKEGLDAVRVAKSQIPQKTFGRPRSTEGDRIPTGEYASGNRNSVPVSPAPSSLDPDSGSIDEAVLRLTPSRPIARPPSALDAPAPEGTATAEAERRATEPPASRAQKGRIGSSTSPGLARPSPAPRAAAASAVAGAPIKPSPPGAVEPKTAAVAPKTAAVEPKTAASKLGSAGSRAAAPKASAADTSGPRDAGTEPPPRGSDDRWDLPRAPAAERPDNKIAKAPAINSKAAAGDIGPVLAGIRAAQDRDIVVRLACDGAITVARAAVFLALRKGVLKGWDGAGTGISRDSVRNLWIPAGSASIFKRVLDDGVAYIGAYGTGIADGLFKAAVGSRGGDVMVQPVLLEQKVVGLMCVDDLRPGPLARGRIESLSNAVGEAFRRVISAGKAD